MSAPTYSELAELVSVLGQQLSTLKEGNWSGHLRLPGVSGGELGKGVESVDAVFRGGGEIAAQGGEVLGAGEGAHSAGYFLAEFRHADLALGGVVVPRRAWVGREPEVVLDPAIDAPGQGPVLGSDGSGCRRGCADAGGVDEQLAVADEAARIDRAVLGQCLDREQVVDHLGGPAPGLRVR